MENRIAPYTWYSGNRMGTIDPSRSMNEQLPPELEYYDRINLGGTTLLGVHMGSNRSRSTDRKVKRCTFENETLHKDLHRNSTIHLKKVDGDVNVTSNLGSIEAVKSTLGNLTAHESINMTGGVASCLVATTGEVVLKTNANVGNVKAHGYLSIVGHSIAQNAESEVDKAFVNTSRIEGELKAHSSLSVRASKLKNVSSSLSEVRITENSTIDLAKARLKLIIDDSTVGTAISETESIFVTNGQVGTLKAEKSITLVDANAKKVLCGGKLSTFSDEECEQKCSLGNLTVAGDAVVRFAKVKRLRCSKTVTAKHSEIKNGESVDSLTLVASTIKNVWQLNVSKGNPACQVKMDSHSSIQKLRILGVDSTSTVIPQSIDIRKVDFSVPTTFEEDKPQEIDIHGIEIDESKPLPDHAACMADFYSPKGGIFLINGTRWKRMDDGTYLVDRGPQQIREVTLEELARWIVPKMRSKYTIIKRMGYQEGDFKMEGNIFTCIKPPRGIRLVQPGKAIKRELPKVEVQIKGGTVQEPIEFVGCTGTVVN